MHLLTGQLRQGVTHNCDRQAGEGAVRWWREKRKRESGQNCSRL